MIKYYNNVKFTEVTKHTVVLYENIPILGKNTVFRVPKAMM